MTKHAKETRSDVLNMRIDPKLKYLADAAAHYKGMSLSGFIEDAIRRALAPETMLDDEPTPGIEPRPRKDVSLWNESLWHDDEATRLFMLGVHHPKLVRGIKKEIWLDTSQAIAKRGLEFTLKNFVKHYKGGSK